MIVTPNPSLDRTFDVDTLAVGEVNRALATHVHPGGKGINVSRALAAHGVASRAVLPVGGPDGAELAALLRGLSLPTTAVPVAEGTRSNVAVVDAAGTTTKVNAAGPTLTAAEVSGLVSAVEELLDGSDGPVSGLVLAGSLPRGAEWPAAHWAAPGRAPKAEWVGKLFFAGGAVCFQIAESQRGFAQRFTG